MASGIFLEVSPNLMTIRVVRRTVTRVGDGFCVAICDPTFSQSSSLAGTMQENSFPKRGARLKGRPTG
eukprot:6915778-Pyramimonas_sp.AAC.1